MSYLTADIQMFSLVSQDYIAIPTANMPSPLVHLYLVSRFSNTSPTSSPMVQIRTHMMTALDDQSRQAETEIMSLLMKHYITRQYPYCWFWKQSPVNVLNLGRP